jgi:hypothetical protein
LQKNPSLQQKKPQILIPRTLSFSTINNWTLLRVLASRAPTIGST